MSDAEAQAQAAADLAAQEAADKENAKTARKAKEPKVRKTKMYVSTSEHSYPFDIQIKGEMIPGNWTRTEKKVEFHVPEDLVDGFEQHYHFLSGNVVEAA